MGGRVFQSLSRPPSAVLLRLRPANDPRDALGQPGKGPAGRTSEARRKIQPPVPKKRATSAKVRARAALMGPQNAGARGNRRYCHLPSAFAVPPFTQGDGSLVTEKTSKHGRHSPLIKAVCFDRGFAIFDWSCM